MKTTPQRPNRPRNISSTDQANPPSRPESMKPPEQSQALHIERWVLLPMRLFLGITFVYAGIQKLMDPQFFNPTARGYIGKQLIAFATGSPLHELLIRMVPHATLIGGLVAYGEIAIGLGALLGLLFRPAAFFGILINLVFFLSATWHVYPYFYGSDIVFLFCWLTLLISGPVNTGLPSIDEWFVQHVLTDEQRTRYAALIAFLLGVNPAPIVFPVPAPAQTSQAKQTAGNRRPPTRYAQMQQAKQQSRRSFLWGLLTGGAGMVILAWLGNSLHLLPGSSTENSSSGAGTPTASGTATVGGTSTPGGSTVIAQINAVQNNNAVTFTLASNGDPGVLVRLNNGKFVAYDATCTHAGCPVSYDPSSQLLQCPCHGAAFDPAKGGDVVQGPAQTPLASVQIQVNNSNGTITTNQ